MLHSVLPWHHMLCHRYTSLLYHTTMHIPRTRSSNAAVTRKEDQARFSTTETTTTVAPESSITPIDRTTCGDNSATTKGPNGALASPKCYYCQHNGIDCVLETADSSKCVYCQKHRTRCNHSGKSEYSCGHISIEPELTATTPFAFI